MEQENIKQNLEIVDIKNLIYTIRGKQVMLDSDVANPYHCETKYINRIVKRNIERFPEEFCFQINQSEFEILRCQFVTSSFENTNYGGRRYLPYVFTEQGIAMISALLKSDIAIQVLYHCGASLKDLGKKCFAINKIEDMGFIEKFIFL